MSTNAAPLLPAPTGVRHRVAVTCVALVLRAGLLISPRPAVLLLRRACAARGAEVARGLRPHTPTDVVALPDERYGAAYDEVLDVSAGRDRPGTRLK